MFVFSNKQNPELLSRDGDLAQEDRSAVQCLKLFGKTLLVKDSSGTSFSTTENCKPESADNRSEGDASFPLKVIPLKLSLETKINESNPPFSWLTLSSSSPTQKPVEGKKQHRKHEAQSSSGSTADSDRERSSDSDSRLHANANAYWFSSRLSKRAYEDCRKGFVPYKRHSQEGNREAEKRRRCICL